MAAFGMNVGGNGDWLPIIKYDSRAGRLFRVERDTAGNSENIDITAPTTRFAIDFGSLQVGYVSFGPQGPVRAMVPYGHTLPPQPQDKDATGKMMSRPGFYAIVAGKDVGGVREWCSNAAILLNALDGLWQTFAASPEAATGKIPLICIASTVPTTSGSGTQKSTNYSPVFQIVGWVDRLKEMGERTVPPPAARPAQHIGNGATQQAGQYGANHVPPPAAAAVTAPPTMPSFGGGDDLNDAIPFSCCWQ